MLSLIAKLGLDKTGFDAGMASAGKQVNKFGGDLKNTLAGAFGVAALAAFTRNIIQTVSHINDLSERLNVSAEALQAIEYAAKQSGSSIDAVATAFRTLSKARLEAMGDPGSKAGQVFSAMGIGGAELKASNLEGIFNRIAAAVKSTDFGAAELAMVEALLGRSSGELIPMFKAGLEESTAEARRLGLVIEEGMVQKIDDVGDSLDRLTAKLKAGVAPAIGFVVDRLRDMYDFMNISVGNAGAVAGTLMGGGSVKDALQAATDHTNEVLDARIKEEAATEEKKKRRLAGMPANPEAERIAKEFEFKGTEKAANTEKARKGFSVAETAFGRIGAFTGASASAAMTPGQAKQIETLQRLHDAMTKNGILIKDVRR